MQLPVLVQAWSVQERPVLALVGQRKGRYRLPQIGAFRFKTAALINCLFYFILMFKKIIFIHVFFLKICDQLFYSLIL
ncbi:hypothetical protein SAMN04487970_10833 [Paenibacillus tianmuensis]|uniref:Uncharacterized protein n=1 Tax=Paenibacillus tianmuensis TaxID=624147 RepID=A0A1G4TZF6_9BACL|nr:hypothetical protein SAMN04487970_10833 [Paenibacillus tianmuensis]